MLELILTPRMKRKIEIYDTTLRDGTQGTGITLSLLDKLRIAEKLDAFGIGFIEGGWPGSNPKDAGFFREAAKRSWTNAKISAFGMTRRRGVDVAEDSQVQSLLDACTPVVALVGKTWKIHVTEVLGVTPDENLKMISETVAHLCAQGREVFYDAEHFFDGFRDDPDYALATLDAAQSAGASALVLCDTNGGSLPRFIGEVVARARRKGVKLGIHTHNDSGLAVANALAAVQAGAEQVQGTINGYGERVGNCNLITLIAALELKLDMECVPRLEHLRDLSVFVDELANVPQNIRAPFVGRAAFTHKGGLHIHAVQKLSGSYEHIEPAKVGNSQTFAISDMSGKSNVLAKAEAFGIKLAKDAPEATAILEQIKQSEAMGFEYETAEASFELLIRRVLGQDTSIFDLKEYHCYFRRTKKKADPCEATVKLLVGGVPEYTVAEGDGPVNALDVALRKALSPFYPWVGQIRLCDYKVRIVDGSHGTTARTRVHIVTECGGRTWGTVGVSDNIIEASWQALVESIEFEALRRNEVV